MKKSTPNYEVVQLFNATPSRDNITHFELGRRLHVDDYYYAREFFQDLDNCRSAGEGLASEVERICAENKKECNNITFVCSGSYSGMLMSEMIQELRVRNDSKTLKLNYAIIDNSKSPLCFYYKPQAEDINPFVILILPITCTFNTAINIRTELRKYSEFENKEQANEILCVFLIHDKFINRSSIDISFSEGCESTKEALLYKSFNWLSWDGKVAIVKDIETDSILKSSPLHLLPTKLYMPEDCPRCFPLRADKLPGNNLRNEYCLIPTRTSNDAPDMVYGLPTFGNYEGTIGPVISVGDSDSCKLPYELESDDIFKVLLDQAHLFGHLVYDKNSYLHYIRRDIFYDKNSINILPFFASSTEKMIKALPTGGRLLIITFKHNRQSRFLTDFVLTIPSDIKVTLLMFDPTNDYLENFEIEYKESQNGYDKTIFFDYLISEAKSLRRVLDRVAIIPGSKGVDKLLFIIDRTTQDSKREILNTQREKQKDYFNAFIKINIPLTSATDSGNPVTEKRKRYLNMLNDCHLDALKMQVGRELERSQPKVLEKLELDQKRLADNDHEGKHRFKCTRQLAKFKISHLISTWIYHEVKDKYNGKDKVVIIDIQLMIDRLISLPELLTQAEIGESNDGRVRKDLITDIVVKTLSRLPFRIYHGIFQSVFRYAVEQMDGILDVLTHEPDKNMLRRFKFYMKRCVELNSNYMVSREFIEKLKKVFIKTDSDVPMTQMQNRHLLGNKYFILLCYKELINSSLPRSIRLEEWINDKELLPLPILNPNHLNDIKSALQDEFYQLGRIIKCENIYPLEIVKRTFLDYISTRLNESDADFERLAENFVSKQLISSTAHKQALAVLDKFLLYSRLQSSGKPAIIENVISMLKTVAIIEQQKSNKGELLPGVVNIMNSVLEIIRTGFESESELEYGFFIKYRNRSKSRGDLPSEHSSNAEQFADNIYTVIPDMHKHQNQPVFLRSGFIYNMLYGLKDKSGEDGRDNLQTFIVLVKDEHGKFVSFRDTYFPADKTIQNAGVLSIEPEAITDDFEQAGVGCSIFNKAGMILLFRIAEIKEIDNSHYEDRGQAVFAFCLPEEKLTSLCVTERITKLTDFISVERVRLLLLIKEDLLKFLKYLFDNDAFITLKSQYEKQLVARSMKHGIAEYLDAYDYLIRDDSLSPSKKLIASNFLQVVIDRHMKSLTSNLAIYSGPSENMLIDNEDSEILNINVVKELFDIILRLTGIGYPITNPKLSISNIPELNCHPIIMEQVLPEILINMKKYSYTSAGRVEYQISYENEYLVFRNSYNFEAKPLGKPLKQHGGINMCNQILIALKKSGYPVDKIEYYSDESRPKEIFVVRFKILSHAN